MSKVLFKRLLSIIIAVLSVAAIPCSVFADEEDNSLPQVEHATAAYLYNFENDSVLFEQNSTERVYPASTVKIMTAIVVLDEFGDKLDTEITVTQEMLNEVSGNQIGFKVGEVVTYEQMLYCMLVNSANDAAIILAHGVAGNTSKFVKLMNDKAAWIGAYNTYYANPTGMHNDAMITTARDTATIAKYACSLPKFLEITSTPKYVMEATNKNDYRNIYNRNCMISKYYSVDYYYSRALGLNAGSTPQGGYAICGVAEDADKELSYLAIVLGAENVDGKLYNYINASNMFDWAFDSFEYKTVLSSKQLICEIDVNLSSALDHVTLTPAEDISVYLPVSVDPKTDIRYSYNTYADSLDAPIEAGTEVGNITVLMGDEILGSCALITTSGVARSDFLYFLSKMKVFSEGRFFRATVVSIIVLSILYVIIKAGWREKKLRRSVDYRRRRR